MIPVSPAISKLVKERVWINLVNSKIVLQPLEPNTDKHLDEESVISVRNTSRNWHLEFYIRELSQ